MELNELRSQIDAIDKQLIELFAKRMDVCESIAEYKRQNGLEVYDQKRENAVLDKVASLCDQKLVEPTTELYRAIFAISRDYQTKNINEKRTDPEEEV